MSTEKSQKVKRASILDLMDLTTPNADWIKIMPSAETFDYYAVTNRLKTRQRVVASGGGNKIVTAGYEENIHRSTDEECPITGPAHSLLKALEGSVPLSTELLELKNRFNPQEVGEMGVLGILKYKLTILTTENHILFCRRVNAPHKFVIDALCKSVTDSKWKTSMLAPPFPFIARENDVNKQFHLDTVGVYTEHCDNENCTCKCKRLSDQIFRANCTKYITFNLIPFSKEYYICETSRDVIDFILALFVEVA